MKSTKQRASANGLTLILNGRYAHGLAKCSKYFMKTNDSFPGPALPLPADREHLPAPDGSGAGGFTLHRIDERDVEYVMPPVGTARVYAMHEDEHLCIYFLDDRETLWENERNYARAA